MSQAERKARQALQAEQQALEWERNRHLLAPKPMAVYVAAAYGYMLPTWRTQDYSRGTYEAYLRAHPITTTAAPRTPKLDAFGNHTIEFRSPA